MEDKMVELERLFAVVAAIGLGTVPLAAAAAPISSSLSLTARAEAGPESAASTDSASWTTTPQPLSVSVRARADDVVGEGYAEAFGSADATWAADGLSGSVVFTKVGWDAASVGPARVSLFNEPTPDWSYSFSADSDGVFQIDYTVAGAGNLFGLMGWRIYWTGSGGDILTDLDPFTPDRAGSATRDLTAGQTYTVRLANSALLNGPEGLFIRGSMDGSFNWRITPAGTPVSEPGSATLVAAAALALLLAARRRTGRGVPARR